MELDRGTLARFDRKLLAGLGQDETFRMVRVSVTEAKWSMWKRYCDSAGISMGRAVVALIDRELISVFGDSSGFESPVFRQRAEEELALRGEKIVSREREVEATDQRLSRWTERLRVWESELEALEQRAELATKLAPPPSKARTKVGRNERCPCGSGLKYKHCHGLAGRRPVAPNAGSRAREGAR